MSEELWITYGKRKQRYRARKVICKTCGKELLIIKNRTNSGYCQSCNAKRNNPQVNDDELFIQEGKSRRRARKINCKVCKKDLLVRLDREHCGYCQRCNAAKRGTDYSYIDGYTTYRKRKLKYTLPICFCCRKEGYDEVLVHHIDGNRKNGKMENLVILCRSCHRSLDYQFSKGLGREEAIEEVKRKKR